MRIDRRWWLLLAAAVLAGAFFALDLGRFLDLQAVKGAQADLQAWRDARPLAAAAIFFAVYVAATAFSVPGAAVLTLVAGAMFGLGWGTLIVSFASAIGATLAFLSARWLLRDWVQARFGERSPPSTRASSATAASTCSRCAWCRWCRSSSSTWRWG